MQEKVEEGEDGKGGGVQTGLVIGTGESGSKKATAGPTRMEVLMEQYSKQTAEHHKRQETELSKKKGPDATARGSLDMSVKARIQRKLRRTWIKVSKCIDCICNGGDGDAAAQVPIMLGSHYRRVADTLGGKSD